MQTEKMRAFILHVLYWCIIAGLIYVCAKYLLPALTPFVIGFCIAFLLKPLINHLTKTTQRGRMLPYRILRSGRYAADCARHAPCNISAGYNRASSRHL